jgi:tetratricopeptide (TPR) repeat protein
VEDLSADAEARGWAGSDSDLVRAARLKYDLALARANGDRFEDACQLADGVIRIYRSLAERRPARFGPELATTLIASGLWSSRLKRGQRAVGALTEAVALHRGLLDRSARLRPMRRLRLRVGLAVALTNLGAALSELGEHEPATEAAEEAVQVLGGLYSSSRLYRLLSRQDPLSFERCLAGALNNLGLILAERGDRDRAWLTARDTVELYRRLAAQAPVAFEGELARSLHNLGVVAAEVGDASSALRATREAVSLHRSLLGIDRADYCLHLGRALCSFARVRAALGVELDQANTAVQEAVVIHEELAALHPKVYSADLHSAYLVSCEVRAALGGEDVDRL